jgi:hypothetical protein
MNYDGRAFRILGIVDEFTRECFAIDVARKLSNEDVLERLLDLFIRCGVRITFARTTDRSSQRSE